jgi:MoaA/NifB/PqqE/SkfB family radical SAM enzyme
MWHRLHLEPIASGCPNRCRHCSEDGGTPFGALMSLDDVKWLVDEFTRVFEKSLGQPPSIRVWLDTYEPTVHPDFVGLKAYELSFFPDDKKEDHAWISTNGYGLARRPDWRAMYENIMAAGYRSIGFAIHGLEDEHDWFVQRKGAFQDVATAIARAREYGMNIQIQVYPTRRNLDTFKQVVDETREMAGETANILVGPAGFYINSRLREYETHLRITKSEWDKIAADIPYPQDMCKNTEASILLNLIENGKEACPFSYEVGGKGPSERILGHIQITPGFDVKEIFLSRRPVHHGNIKKDGIERIWQSILDTTLPPLPEPEQLVKMYGDFESEKLLIGGDSVYMKLCDAYWRRTNY